MNKLHILGMMALACVGFTSCEPDDSPKISAPTEFVLNTPPFAEQLYELTPDGEIELTCSQPNYGLTLATSYSVEISMLEDFGASLPAPEEGAAPYSVVITPPNPHSAVITLPESKIAEAILAMRGITTEEDYTDIPAHALYVRAYASINDQAITKITSNTITLEKVKGYCAFSAKTYDVLYNPGEANGWDFGKCQQLIAYETGKYHGFIYITGGFKFTEQDNWTGTNYGASAPGVLTTQDGDTNIPVPDEGVGLYYVTVDIEAMTYTTEFITTVGVVGAFNEWDAAGAPAMSTEDHLVYTLTTVFSGGGFKFVFTGPSTADNPWMHNLGGTFEELVFGNGDNLPDEAGEHTVTLDISRIPYTATFE